MNKSLSAWLPLLVSLLAIEPAALGFAKTPPAPPVRWEDIKSWQRLGPSWAAGRDAGGRLLGIYDLSYPDLTDRVKLGKLPKRADLQPALQALRAEEESGRPEAGAIRAAREALEKLLGGGVKLAGDMTLHALWPQGWHKSIPWRDQMMAQSAQAPQVFAFSDIDWGLWSQSFKDGQGFGKALETIDRAGRKAVLELGLELPDEPGAFLRCFEWVSTDDAYEMIFRAPSKPKLSRPALLADVRNPQNTLWNEVGIDVYQSAISFMLGQIPIPVVASLLQTTLGSFFSFRDNVRRAHSEMVLENLQAAQEATPDSRFGREWASQLSVEERVRMVDAILYGQTSLGSVFYWIWEKPQKNWAKDIQKGEAATQKSLTWLAAHGEDLSALNPRFGIGTDRDSRQRLYLLARPRLLQTVHPNVAIDYATPRRIEAERIAMEAGTITLDFVTGLIPIPLVGTVIGWGWYFAIEKPVRLSQRWDARLQSHLEWRASQGETWTLELQTLQRQRSNPLELPWDLVPRLIRGRAEAMGLTP